MCRSMSPIDAQRSSIVESWGVGPRAEPSAGHSSAARSSEPHGWAHDSDRCVNLRLEYFAVKFTRRQNIPVSD